MTNFAQEVETRCVQWIEGLRISRLINVVGRAEYLDSFLSEMVSAVLLQNERCHAGRNQQEC